MQEQTTYRHNLPKGSNNMQAVLYAGRMEVGTAPMRPLVSSEELRVLLGGKDRRGDASSPARGRMPLLEVMSSLLGLRRLFIPKLATLLVFLPMAWIMIMVHLLGAGPACAMLSLLGFAGAVLVRRTGLSGFRELSACLNQGRDPQARHMEDFLLFLAGVCLLIPGPVTLAAAVSLLIPGPRDRWARRLRRSMRVWNNNNLS